MHDLRYSGDICLSFSSNNGGSAVEKRTVIELTRHGAGTAMVPQGSSSQSVEIFATDGW